MEEENNKEKLKVITIDELRQCKGYENISDNEAKNIINAIKQISLMIHKIICKI